MLPRRSLLARGLLIALTVASGMAGADPGVGVSRLSFRSPQDGEIVVGPTTFEFDVEGSDILRVDLYVAGQLIGSCAGPDWRLSWNAPSGLSKAPIKAIGFGSSGPIATATIRTSTTILGDEIQVDVVQLYPVVTDRRGRYVRGLTRDDFTVTENGRAVELTSFESEVSDLELVLLLDTSASMQSSLAFVKEASGQLVEKLVAGERVSVYGFNQSLRLMTSSTSDRNLTKERIRSLSALGGTALYDGLVEVLEDLRPVLTRTAIVIYSDGEDLDSLTPLSRAVERAREAEVLVYAIATEDALGDKVKRDDLQELAQATGGSAFFVEQMKELPAIYAGILADLRAQYALSYTPPPGPDGRRSISVITRDKGHRVRYRESYDYKRLTAPGH